MPIKGVKSSFNRQPKIIAYITGRTVVFMTLTIEKRKKISRQGSIKKRIKVFLTSTTAIFAPQVSTRRV